MTEEMFSNINQIVKSNEEKDLVKVDQLDYVGGHK